jgi:hypothetical protein
MTPGCSTMAQPGNYSQKTKNKTRLPGRLASRTYKRVVMARNFLWKRGRQVEPVCRKARVIRPAILIPQRFSGHLDKAS